MGAASGPASGDNRVNRGGSWNNNARNCRSANRNRNNPENRNNNLGFRVALAPNRKRIGTGLRPVPLFERKPGKRKGARQGW